MLNQGGFDQWSGRYDNSIESYSQGYPFAGYYQVLAYVQSLVDIEKDTKILDLGVGTGLLTTELYQAGGDIYGIDFSQKMLELAKEKMPRGRFYHSNLKEGLPAELEEIKFDYILSSYVIHHLTTQEKLELFKSLKQRLKEDGKIIIADIAFFNKDDLEQCKEESENQWDESEVYIILNELQPAIDGLNLDINYTQISSCAGVLEMG